MRWVQNSKGILIPRKEAGFIVCGPAFFQGASAVGTAAYWDPAKQGGGFTLSNSDKTVSATSGGWNGGMGVTVQSSGKKYFEIHVDTLGTYFLVGVANINFVPYLSGNYLGSNANSWSYQNSGTYYHGGSLGSVAATYTTGDVVGVALDCSAGNLWFSVNGTWVQGDPATGASPLMTGVTDPVYPAVGLYSSGGVATLRVQNSEFSNAPPPGFSSWSGL